MTPIQKDWEDYGGRNTDTTAAMIEKAYSLGATVLIPLENELFLDLDTEEQFEALPEKVKQLSSLLRCKVEITMVSPSNSGLPHRHVILVLPAAIDDQTRAGFQMFLGSDPIREVLALRRVLWEIDNPIIFIEGGDWKKKG